MSCSFTVPHVNVVHQNFYSMLTDDWIHAFDESIPMFVSEDLVEANTKKITFDDVQKWVEVYDGITGRFRFFESRARTSIFYQKVAKPLLSMRTVGSIDVERRIKPMKNDIITKQRNRLSCTKATVLMRASENLNHLLRAKLTLGKKINDSLVPPPL